MSASDTQGARSFLEFASFRMDREKQLLLREGKPVPLTPKAFQLLAVLIEGRNEVVSKDELMKAVWPDTFVEETNLSRNIFALRKALGETDRNRFIVTVPGHGYRFAEQVRVVSEPPRTIVSATHRKVQLRIIEGRRWGPIVIATAVVLVISAGVFKLVWSRRPVLTAKDSVLLAAFANTTSDPVFDGTLRQGLEIQLEQSPFLSLVSEERIRRALTLMGQPSDAQVSGDTAREVCERTGGAVVVEGSIAPLGRQAVLGLRARSCRTGDVIAEEQEQVARKEDVLGALTRIAARFRSRLGESRPRQRRPRSRRCGPTAPDGRFTRHTAPQRPCLSFSTPRNWTRSLRWPMPLSVACTPISINLSLRPPAPPAPGSCAKEQVNAKSSSSARTTRSW